MDSPSSHLICIFWLIVLTFEWKSKYKFSHSLVRRPQNLFENLLKHTQQHDAGCAWYYSNLQSFKPVPVFSSFPDIYVTLSKAAALAI